MRRFSTFAGLMPHDLIEATAKIYSNFENKHCTGDKVSFCRFGYSISWCDGSGQAYFVEDEKIETAIEAAKKYLASKGWHMGEITYTGAVLTDEIINEHTTKMQSKQDALNEYARFLQLKMDCLKRPWFDAVRSEINGTIGIYNVVDLPDDIRNSNAHKELIGYCNNEHTCVQLGYKIVSDNYAHGGEWVNIDDAKARLGLPDTATDIEVVDKVVADLIDSYNHRTDTIRKLKERFITKFTQLTGLFEQAIHECAADSTHVPVVLAVLESYLYIDWGRAFHKRDGIIEILNKFERRADVSTIKSLALNRTYFDWSTLKIEKKDGLTIGKVMIDPDIYAEVKKQVKSLEPIEVKERTELRAQYKSRFANDWRATDMDTQWWHFSYGINPDGDAIFADAFGPENNGDDNQ